jgi:eukaryotic-like serine/threonine-protein kinase
MPQAHQLGRYQLLDRIAFGGMAEIYRAKTFDAEGRARLVAVKRVLQHLTTDDDFIRMLVDEAKITATLDHPAIARVYEFSQAGEEYFIAMEYVDGKDTRSILEKHRQLQQPVPPEHVAWVIANVAEGLHAAHTQTDADGKPMMIVHRDVSPSNVLCSYQGDVKLCDFGIAKATLTRVQTRTGVIKGKVKYMSPEQAMGRKLDARSDLFSLGTVMYEMLTLEAPFIAQTEVELIFAVRDARKRDAREVVSAIPTSLNDILNRTMERQRTDRFQSGRELARDLRGWLEKNHPNYRRAAFGRFMRILFKDEIEKELRQLEGWVLDQGDASKVGVNLIADALPQDAPFRGFSAAASGVGRQPQDSVPDMPAQKTSIYSREQKPLPDLHAEPTHILNRQAIAPRGDLHQRETMMLEGRAADELRAQIRGGLGISQPGLHEHETKLFDDAPPAPAETPSGATALPALETRLHGRDEPVAAIPPPPAPPPNKPPGHKGKLRPQNDTSPDPKPRSFADDSKESTMPKAKGPEDFANEDSDNPTDPRSPRD